jgi:hypothetical protein
MSRMKLKHVFSNPARRDQQPRSVWPRPDRAIPPMHRVREEHEVSERHAETRRTKHP